MDSGRYREAEQKFRRSLEIEPTVETYINLGELALSQDRPPDAVRYLEKAVLLGPKRYRAWGGLGSACSWTKGGAAEAASAYQKAADLAAHDLELNGKDAETRGFFALYLAETHRGDEALREIGRAMKDAPQNLSVLYCAAIVYELAGKRDRALEQIVQLTKNGFSVQQILIERELANLRADPRFAQLMNNLK